MANSENSRKMNAIVMHEYGNSDVLKYEEVNVPEIKADEILIRVEYASVNPYDWKIREGYAKSYLQLRLPAILGIDAAGTVEEVGDKVNKFKAGDKVFCRADFTRGGSYAEYIAVGERQVAHAPRSVPLRETAGLPVVAGTAWSALFEVANLRRGQRVLITGASGGVGSVAVQLAKNAGAYVIGTTSGKNTDFVKSLGADEVVDYTTGNFSERIDPVDVVFDTVDGDTLAKSYELVKKGGVLVTSAGQPDDELAHKHGISAKGLMVSTDGKRLEEIAALVDAGKLRIHVDKEYPLSEIKAAHDFSQSAHVRGKIIIRIG